MRWWWRVLAIAALAGLGVAMTARPAGATLTGPCQATGTLVKAGKTYDAAKITGVTIPRKDTVAYDGSTRASGKRLAVGQVEIKLPPPFGSVTLGDWGKDGQKTGSSGKKSTYDYDFSSLLAGIKVPLSGEDNEPGLPKCSGSVVVSLEGHSPLLIASLVLTVVAIAGVSLSVRARRAT
jgi:hypothetical protein